MINRIHSSNKKASLLFRISDNNKHVRQERRELIDFVTHIKQGFERELGSRHLPRETKNSQFIFLLVNLSKLIVSMTLVSYRVMCKYLTHEI